MEEFYARVSNKLQETLSNQDAIVKERWESCLMDAAAKGIPPNEVKCKLDFKPRLSAVIALQTEALKLEVVHIPSSVEEDNDPTPPYRQPVYHSEEFYIRVRRPEVQTGCSVQ